MPVYWHGAVEGLAYTSSLSFVYPLHAYALAYDVSCCQRLDIRLPPGYNACSVRSTSNVRSMPSG